MQKLIARPRVLIEWLLLVLTVPAMTLWLAQRPGLQHLDGILRDRLLEAMPATPSGQVVMITVDRASLDALGRWPWSNSTHARLLETLQPSAPRSVLLDLPLDRPDPWMDHPGRLVAAMGQLPVYLVQHDVPDAATVEMRNPLPVLMAAAAGVGHSRLVPEQDGVVRTLYALEGRPGHLVPYVGLLLTGQTPATLVDKSVQPANPAAAWQRMGPFSFALPRTSGSFATFSYAQVLRGEAPADAFRGRDVLVGVDADADLGDLWPVSASRSELSLAGVEINANAIDALRTGRTLNALDGLPRLLWIVLPVVLGLYVFLRRERHAAMAGVLLAALCCLASAALLSQRYWLSPVAPVAGLMLGYLLWSWQRQSLMFGYFRRQLAKLDAGLVEEEEPVERRRRPLRSAKAHILALDDAVERLQALQKLFRQSLRDLPVAVVLCGRDGSIRHANPASRRLLPLLRPQEPQAGGARRLMLPEILESLRPAGAPPLTPTHWSVAHEGARYTHAGFVFRVRCVALGGSAQGWAVVLDDLTAEHRIQAERDQWLRFLSHDLRSPQVNILSCVALDERNHPHAPGRAELAAAVRREVERTLALAEGFMDLSQAEAGDFARDEVLVEAAAVDAADQVWAYARTRDVQVQVHARLDDDAFVRGNGSLLTRALVNLLNNAIRHSARGSLVRICIGLN
ncbi:MAG: CHASE2 domain-containing protein, partial [Comamonadaceae bacterium]